jgi:hypothetical protein
VNGLNFLQIDWVLTTLFGNKEKVKDDILFFMSFEKAYFTGHSEAGKKHVTFSQKTRLFF